MKNNNSESEKNLEIENKELRKKLANVTKEFNDYKLLIHNEVIPRNEDYRLRAIEAEKDIDQLKNITDALVNFVFENGLGERYNKAFINDIMHHVHEDVNYKSKNEIRFAEVNEGFTKAKLNYQLKKSFLKN